ncbi:MAG: LPS translocon maturation chaperone LptM [Nevskiales bacterium]
MTRASIIRFALILCFCLGYAACGQKGDLYMPEQAEAEQAANSDN